MLDDVVDEAQLRELANWMREHMEVYPSGAALAAHMPDLVPENPVHALLGRFDPVCNNPDKTQQDIASVAWRLPPRNTHFHRTDRLSPAPQCVEVFANSILWDPSACNGADMDIGL